MLREASENVLINELYRKGDEYALGLHLIEEHTKRLWKSVFENSYCVFILNTCSRKSLEVSEHKFIHILKTL